MNSIECECEKSPDNTPPVQHITTDVDLEITRHRLKALLNRIGESEYDLAPDDLVFRDIDELFDKDGDLRYFKKPLWTDKELSEDFHVPLPQVKHFLKEAYPHYCYEERVDRRMWKMSNALSRLGYAYKEQQKKFAELKESYDALKGHCASYGEDGKEDPTVSMLKTQIDLYKTHISCLERDLSVEKEYRFEALKAAEKNKELLQRENRKFNICFWVSIVIVVVTYLIHLF